MTTAAQRTLTRHQTVTVSSQAVLNLNSESNLAPPTLPSTNDNWEAPLPLNFVGAPSRELAATDDFAPATSTFSPESYAHLLASPFGAPHEPSARQFPPVHTHFPPASRVPDYETHLFDLCRKDGDELWEDHWAISHQEEEAEQDRDLLSGILSDFDKMPAPAIRKRTRAAASLDDNTGPSSSRHRSARRTTTPVRPTSSRGNRTTRFRQSTAVVNLISDDNDPAFQDDDIFADAALEYEDENQVLYDLTNGNSLPEELLRLKEDNSIRLSKFECIICMDAASNLTVTHCGHMFCGQCLHQAMHAEITKKVCPMCRQKLELRPKLGQPQKTAKTFFHLEFKKKPKNKKGKQPIKH